MRIVAAYMYLYLGGKAALWKGIRHSDSSATGLPNQAYHAFNICMHNRQAPTHRHPTSLKAPENEASQGFHGQHILQLFEAALTACTDAGQPANRSVW